MTRLAVFYGLAAHVALAYEIEPDASCEGHQGRTAVDPHQSDGVPADRPDGVADEDDPPASQAERSPPGLSSRRLGSGSPHRPSHVAASVGSRVTELTSTFHPTLG